MNAFVELMEKSLVNPLSSDQCDIISLSTGIAVSPDIANDLLQAHQTGEEAYKSAEVNVWKKSHQTPSSMTE